MKQKTNKNLFNKFKLPAAVAVLYLVLYFVSPDKIINSLKYSYSIFKQVVPVIIFIILFMWGLKYIPNKAVKKYIGRNSGLKGWLFAALGGMISHGPIYAWYPLLKEFEAKGLSRGQTAVFLYNRAIKLPLIPMLIHYFGLKYTIKLTIFMFLVSFLQGSLIDIIMKDSEAE